MSVNELEGSYILYFDGASRGNPGPSGAGVLIVKDNVEIWSESKWLGLKKTNNEAEYEALIMGLEKAIKMYKDNILTTLLIRGDSNLIINQVAGKWKVSASNLIPLHKKAKKLVDIICNYKLEHIRRDKNKLADAYANNAIDNNL